MGARIVTKRQTSDMRSAKQTGVRSGGEDHTGVIELASVGHPRAHCHGGKSAMER